MLFTEKNSFFAKIFFKYITLELDQPLMAIFSVKFPGFSFSVKL